MALKNAAKRVLPPILFDAMKSLKRQLAYRRYMARGGMPFSTGYGIYHKEFIGSVLTNGSLLGRFRDGGRLPEGYGVGVDERCVEYPWMISQLEAAPGRLLDAGSTLNHGFLLDLPILHTKVIDILTLAPEAECFWQRGISYLYHDLRDVPIRNGYYDTISCLSTLEHVGCDTSNYTGKDADRQNLPEDYLLAIGELCRVLRPGGSLLISVPFGTYSHLGVQQQFDGLMLAKARAALGMHGEVVERFYLYSADGWNVATESDCAQARYVEWAVGVWAHGTIPDPVPREPDRAVAARAVACLRLNKSPVTRA